MMFFVLDALCISRIKSNTVVAVSFGLHKSCDTIFSFNYTHIFNFSMLQSCNLIIRTLSPNIPFTKCLRAWQNHTWSPSSDSVSPPWLKFCLGAWSLEIDDGTRCYMYLPFKCLVVTFFSIASNRHNWNIFANESLNTKTSHRQRTELVIININYNRKHWSNWKDPQWPIICWR